ncbi:MFS transporter, partial [Mycobacterium sp. ITM-2017-0098]
MHWAWVVAGVSFVAILGAAGFRSVPGVMMNPLHHEFGWSNGTVGLAMSVNMTLFGLTAPFAAALMDRFGIRPVLTTALGLIA